MKQPRVLGALIFLIQSFICNCSSSEACRSPIPAFLSLCSKGPLISRPCSDSRPLPRTPFIPNIPPSFTRVQRTQPISWVQFPKTLLFLLILRRGSLSRKNIMKAWRGGGTPNTTPHLLFFSLNISFRILFSLQMHYSSTIQTQPDLNQGVCNNKWMTYAIALYLCSLMKDLNYELHWELHIPGLDSAQTINIKSPHVGYISF